MRITFVIPALSLYGGIRVVFEYANRLIERGHQVTLVYPARMDHDSKSYLGVRIKTFFTRAHVDWFNVKAKIKIVPNLSEKFIPGGDIVVATLWKTAEWINTYGIKKGNKIYLVQSYEIWSGPKKRVHATYKMASFKKIVISTWLKNIMEGQLNQKALGPVINGVNLSQFYNEDKKYHIPRRIGMVYSHQSLKGSGDGIRAFEIARSKYPDIQLVMFGLSWPGIEVPEDVEFHFNPPQEKLRKIYSSCDIWILPSWLEGCPMPPAEAMACKCALIATDVGGIRDYTEPGVTALVSPAREPEALASNLIKLLDDEKELKRISMAGYNKIKEFTWDKATDQLEEIFKQSLEEKK